MKLATVPARIPFRATSSADAIGCESVIMCSTAAPSFCPMHSYFKAAGRYVKGGRQLRPPSCVGLVPRPQIVRHGLFKRLFIERRSRQQVQPGATTYLGNGADALTQVAVLGGVGRAPPRE